MSNHLLRKEVCKNFMNSTKKYKVVPDNKIIMYTDNDT